MVDDEEAVPSVASRLIALLAVSAICMAAATRLAGVGLHAVPRWIAAIALVACALELLSVAWNVARRRPWSEKTLFDRVGDILIWLPWPW